MATTTQEYTGNGSNYINGASIAQCDFTFPYLKQTDVKVSLNGTTLETTKYTFPSSTSIQFTSGTETTTQEANGAPKDGVTILVYRDTNVDTAKAVYAAGSSIRARDLNNNKDQSLFFEQEVRDTTNPKNNVTSANIVDGTIVNDDINASAAIQGSKITPAFGSQNVSTGGNFQCGGGQFTFSNDAGGKIRFLDTNNNPDYNISSSQGTFQIGQSLDDAIFKINTDKHIDLIYGVDISGGLNVTGQATFGNVVSLTGNSPRIQFVESDQSNENWYLATDNKNLTFRNDSLGNLPFPISISGFDGTIDFGTNVDCNAGLDVTGDINGTGDLFLTADTPKIRLIDNNADDDFQISNFSGNFIIKDITNNVDRFTIASDGTTTVANNLNVGAGLDVTGEITGTSNLDLPSDARLNLGDNDEFFIFHQSSNGNAIIKEQGGGGLSLQSNGSYINFWDTSNSVAMFQATTGGGIYLRHADTIRIQTTSGGVDVTGDLTITDNTPSIDLIDSDNSNKTYRILNNAGGLKIQDTSSGSALTRITLQSGGNTVIEENLVCNGQIVSQSTTGSGSTGLKIDNSNESFVQYFEGGGANATFVMSYTGSGGTDIRFTHDGEVQLRHAGQEKFKTTSTGVDVTGHIDITGELNLTGGGNKYFDVDTLSGTQSLRIRHRNNTGTQFDDAAKFTADGGADLYFNGGSTPKLSTTANGVDVNGTLNISQSGPDNAGLTILDGSATSSAPWIEVIGRRDNSNFSPCFSGKIHLARYRSAAKVVSGNVLGAVAFGGNHTEGGLSNILYSASISGVASDDFDSATDMPTDLVFYTGSTGRTKTAANVTAGTERMRITATGNVAIGDLTNPDRKLHIQTNGESYIRLTDNDITAETNSAEGVIEFETRDTNNQGVNALIGAYHQDAVGNAYLRFDTGGAGSATERMRITADGTTIASGTLEFAETLASYDPTEAGSGTETSTTCAISLMHGHSIRVNSAGYLKNLLQIETETNGAHIRIGDNYTNYIGDVILQPGNGHKVIANYDGSPKLETTANGISVANGSVTSPSITFDQSNTGLFKGSGGRISFASGGNQIWYADGGGFAVNNGYDFLLKNPGNSAYTGFKSPSSPTNYVLTMPDALPSVAGYALTSDTSGVLSWAEASGGSSATLEFDGTTKVEAKASSVEINEDIYLRETNPLILFQNSAGTTNYASIEGYSSGLRIANTVSTTDTKFTIQQASSAVNKILFRPITVAGALNQVTQNADVCIGHSMTGSGKPDDLNAFFPVAGGVELYWMPSSGASSKKFETTETGIAVTSTDASELANPILKLDRNSASPADDDILGDVQFVGRNSANEEVTYGSFMTKIDDASDGTEDGRLIYKTMKAGALTTVLDIKPDQLKVNNVSEVYFGDPIDSIKFEGATGNSNETTIQITDPTADRTITVPDTTGTFLVAPSFGVANQVLQTDGSGGLSWVNQSGGSFDGGTITNDITISKDDPTIIFSSTGTNHPDYKLMQDNYDFYIKYLSSGGSESIKVKLTGAQLTSYVKISSTHGIHANDEITCNDTITAQEAKMCHLKSDTTASVSTTAAVIDFNQAESTNHSRFTVSNGEITVLDTGFYQIKANVNYQSAADSRRNTIKTEVQKNGTSIQSAEKYTFIQSHIKPIIIGHVNSDGTNIKGEGYTVARNSTGNYTVTFDTAMPDANYVVNGQIIEPTDTKDDVKFHVEDGQQSTTSFIIRVYQGDNGTAPDADTDRDFYFIVNDLSTAWGRYGSATIDTYAYLTANDVIRIRAQQIDEEGTSTILGASSEFIVKAST